MLFEDYKITLLFALFPDGKSQAGNFFVLFDDEDKQHKRVNYNLRTNRWVIYPEKKKGGGLLDLWMIYRQKTFAESEEEILRLLGEWPQKEPSKTASTAPHKKPPLNFKQVAQASLSDSLGIVQSLLPNGKRQGSEYVALNPKRADRKLGSFRINLQTGKWADFAIGKTGGDLISLWAYLKDTSQLKAAQELGARYSLLE